MQPQLVDALAQFTELLLALGDQHLALQIHGGGTGAIAGADRYGLDRALEVLRQAPSRHLAQDVGRAVAALARGDFPYATGQVVNIDGGMLVGRL